MQDQKVQYFLQANIALISFMIITVYNKNTREYPGEYVARIFDSDKPTNIVMTDRYLESLNARIKNEFPCMTWIPRSSMDVPWILGTYI